MTCDPKVKRAHVQAERRVTASKLLQFVNQAQWMYRGAATKRCLSVEGLTFRVNHIEDMRGERRHASALDLRRQGTQGLRDIPRQLDAGAVAIIHIRGQDVDVDDAALASGIPQGGPIFDGIISHSDDEIGGVEQPIGGLIGELTDPPTEIVEQYSAASTRQPGRYPPPVGCPCRRMSPAPSCWSVCWPTSPEAQPDLRRR
jgi:hypothetical protein